MVASKTTAAYDAHADWYNDYMSAANAGEYIRRVHGTLGNLLGRGRGRCLDVCCGMGAHGSAVAGLGWTPVGVDLSRGQLRHAARRLPVAVADATALPLADLLNATVDAGLRLVRTVESGPGGGPELFGFLGVKG